MRPEPAELILMCAACERIVRLVYIPCDTATQVTWRCPALSCRKEQALDLEGKLIKAFVASLAEENKFR